MNTILINDHGRALVLDYEHFRAYHGGGALAAAAVGFRAMEYAANILSQDEIWDRKDVSVTTRHGGPGTRDAIEYVTRCVTRGRFHVDRQEGSSCASQAAFHYSVSDGRQTVVLAWCPDVTGHKFLDAVRHFNAEQSTDREHQELEDIKAEVAAHVMAKPLEQLFTLELQAQAAPEHA